MSSRWAIAGTLAAALALAGCARAPTRWASTPAPPADPDRWERAACRQGEYPTELDARALARAHHEDLRARRGGEASPFAAARLASERSAFDARCAAWREATARADLAF